MSPLLLLSILGTVESIIYWWRIRTATKPGAWASGVSTFAVCACRLVFVWAGASLAMRDANPVWAVIAYGIPAAVLTGLIHACATRGPRG